MNSLYEYLAREQQREFERRAREQRLARQVSAQRRYHRAVPRRRSR